MNAWRTYLEKGFVHRTDRVLGDWFLFSSFSRISMKDFVTENPENPTHRTVTLTAYTGQEKLIHDIKNLFEARNHPALQYALLHGSIASDEVIPYSDFDGILIVKASAIKSAFLLRSLRKLIELSEEIIIRFDPLQHHGWQIVFAEELSALHASVVPSILLDESKLIYRSADSSYTLDYYEQSSDQRKVLKHLLDSIRRKCRQPNKIRDRYALKNLLSEILLSPAVFLQSQSPERIGKKDSFTLIRAYADAIELDILDRASHVRRQWKSERINPKIALFHRLKRKGCYLSDLAPSITAPEELDMLSEQGLSSIRKYCDQLEKIALT